MARVHAGDVLFRVVLDVQRIEDGTRVPTDVLGPYETLAAARRVASAEKRKWMRSGHLHAASEIQRASLDWQPIS